MSPRPRACPECGSGPIARILYGMPSPDAKLMRDIDEGRIVLGGCCVTDNDPRWQCTACQYRFGRPKTPD